MNNQIIENHCPECKSENYIVEDSDTEVLCEGIYWTWYCYCPKCHTGWQFCSSYTISQSWYEKIESRQDEEE